MAVSRGKRLAVIDHVGGRCQQCGKQGTQENGYWVDLEVDHIQREADGGDHSVENLRVLCYECHDLRHGRRKPRRRPTQRRRGIWIGVNRKNLNLKLPEELHAQAKMEAARRRTTLQQLVEDAVRAYLESEERQQREPRKGG